MINWRLILAITIIIGSLLSLSTPTGQIFAASKNFICQPAPKINAPPNLSPSTVDGTLVLRPVCPAGLVPQPMGPSSTGSQPVEGPSSVPGQAPSLVRGPSSVPGQAPFLSTPPPVTHSLRVSHGSSSDGGFHYVSATQDADARVIGASGSYTQEKPYVAPQDGHSLAELAVLSPYTDSNGQPAKQQQIVEIGWIVEGNDPNAHLFVFHWINRNAICPASCGQTCYNACGYVQYSRTAYPSMTVNVTATPQKYAIMYYQGNWWLWYQDQWIGYFPGSLWSNTGTTFNKASVVQWFGEIAGGLHTQMGNGIFGDQQGSASITKMNFIRSSLRESKASITPDHIQATDPDCYNYESLTPQSFTYGGPGCS